MTYAQRRALLHLRNGESHTSLTLALALGCSLSAARHTLSGLHKLGKVERSRKGNGRHIYKVTA